MKPTKQLLTLSVIIYLFSLSVYAQENIEYKKNYSIKNRWNTKLSMSYNRTNSINVPFMQWDNIPPHPIQAKLNLRAECNYGVLNWLELGGYLGYIRYDNAIYHSKIMKNNPDGYHRGMPYAFAPTFGVNVNVHLLPFWVKNKDSRWELYVTAKYGGAYLINHIEFWMSGFTMDMGNGNILSSSELHCLPNRYRHIYGVGIGGGVYYWNLFGLYAETMVGQYSYFPEICNSLYTVRAGISFKFYSKKYKAKKKTEKDADIIFH